MISNPWLSMGTLSQRRVDTITSKHNLFWIIDDINNYGLYFKTTNKFSVEPSKLNLKGIRVLKRNTNDGVCEFCIVLNDQSDWQIFLLLCNDLIVVANKYFDEVKMINSVEMRLVKWQKLLKQNKNNEMTIERQMGLFSELMFLKDILIPNLGIKNSINSWVGAEFDKQDFLIDHSAIEVKSYKTSKGSIITISSALQLQSEKDFFIFGFICINRFRKWFIN